MVLRTFVLVFFFQYVIFLIFFAIKSRDLRSKEHRGYGEKFGDFEDVATTHLSFSV